MAGRGEEPREERHYPAMYEKAIPIALGVLALLIVAVLLLALAIALHLLPGVTY